MDIRKALLLLLVLLAAPSCQSINNEDAPERILFVGNSLTYYGNVPALYAALGIANGHPTRSDMIVEGGATLSQRVVDGSVERALSTRKYDALVIQERGGDLLCSFGPESCVESRAAIRKMAHLAQHEGIKIVMLGSYQPNPEVSLQLVEKESAAAGESSVTYAEVSETLRQLTVSAPHLTWFAADGMHPGKDLALLHAILVYQALHGAPPEATPLQTNAPIYGQDSGLEAQLRRADAPAPHAGTPTGTKYTSATVALILKTIAEKDG